MLAKEEETLYFLTSLFLVSIRSIREVRPGKNTEVMKNKEIASTYSEDCIFSIIHGDEFESLDLIAMTPEEANIWVTGLNFLIGVSKCKLGLNSKVCVNFYTMTFATILMIIKRSTKKVQKKNKSSISISLRESFPVYKLKLPTKQSCTSEQIPKKQTL